MYDGQAQAGCATEAGFALNRVTRWLSIGWLLLFCRAVGRLGRLGARYSHYK